MSQSKAELKFQDAIRSVAVALGMLGGVMLSIVFSDTLWRLAVVIGSMTSLLFVRVIYMCVAPSAPMMADKSLRILEDRARVEKATGRLAKLCRLHELYLGPAVIFLMLAPGWIFASGTGWLTGKPSLLFWGSIIALFLMLAIWWTLAILARREIDRMARSSPAPIEVPPDPAAPGEPKS